MRADIQAPVPNPPIIRVGGIPKRSPTFNRDLPKHSIILFPAQAGSSGLALTALQSPTSSFRGSGNPFDFDFPLAISRALPRTTTPCYHSAETAHETSRRAHRCPARKARGKIAGSGKAQAQASAPRFSLRPGFAESPAPCALIQQAFIGSFGFTELAAQHARLYGGIATDLQTLRFSTSTGIALLTCRQRSSWDIPSISSDELSGVCARIASALAKRAYYTWAV